MQLPFASVWRLERPREDSTALVELLTAMLLFAYPPETWYIESPLRALALAGIAFRSVRVSPLYWLACASLWITTVLVTWTWAGNHKYLVAYWCLTLAACRALPTAAERLQVTGEAGRLLLGLAMGAAALAKGLSESYVSGDFFAFELLHFQRFHHFSVLVADCQPTALQQNRVLLESMEGGAIDAVKFATCPGIGWLGAFLTWWTIGIEAALAVCFLFPKRSARLDLAAHALFALFIVTTYTVATVVWFGWTLCVLALAHARQIGARGLCVMHVALIATVVAYELPLGDVVESVARRLAGTG